MYSVNFSRCGVEPHIEQSLIAPGTGFNPRYASHQAEYLLQAQGLPEYQPDVRTPLILTGHQFHQAKPRVLAQLLYEVDHLPTVPVVSTISVTVPSLVSESCSEF